MQVRHYPTLVIALGFASLAGVFAVHGLATPGVLQRGEQLAGAGAVVAVSGQLSLLVPALLFALRYSPLVRPLERLLAPTWLIGAAGAGIAIYAVLALLAPQVVAGALTMTTGTTYDPYGKATNPFAAWGPASTSAFPALQVAASGVAIALFVFAAARQAREFIRSRLPTHGALVASFLFLAQAQVSQLVAPVWTVAWWEYHGLMLGAVVLAMGALFLELDRRRGLERFLPPNVVERVVAGDSLRLAGERRTVTILFADLRGSTALAERLAPEQTVAALNAYLRLMARAVIDRGGILDKFLGDGLMAIFGALGDRDDGARAAAGAALDIRRAVTELNAAREQGGEPVLRFGVGIHSGEVVLGEVGLPDRSDYTALGDTVNTASRMESLCKEYGVDAVLSAEAARRIDGAVPLRPLGAAAVRGKAEPLRVFTLA